MSNNSNRDLSEQELSQISENPSRFLFKTSTIVVFVLAFLLLLGIFGFVIRSYEKKDVAVVATPQSSLEVDSEVQSKSTPQSSELFDSGDGYDKFFR